MTQLNALLRKALQLEEEDRVLLASALLESVGESPDDLSAKQRKEIMRRREEMLRNPEIGIPWETIKAGLTKR